MLANRFTLKTATKKTTRITKIQNIAATNPDMTAERVGETECEIGGAIAMGAATIPSERLN